MPYTTKIINGKLITFDEDGKPCKTCNSLKDFQMAGMAMGIPAAAPAKPTSAEIATSKSSVPEEYRGEPLDSWELGNHTWNFLHTMAATYPKTPSEDAKKQMREFISAFANFYPCQPCAEDFREWIKTNNPNVESRNALSFWFCDAHNAVNKKLGKPAFDCRYWTARWKEGWDDFKRASRE